MSVFGGLENNAPDAEDEPVWASEEQDVKVNTEQAYRPKKRRRRLQITVLGVELAKGTYTLFFDAQAELPRFQPQYRRVRRTYPEIKRFADHLSNANPECFVPALPSPNSSISDPEKQQRALKHALQLWFDRICRSPLLVRDDEFFYFVEATTGYVPSVRLKPPASGLARKMVKQLAPPPDDCQELIEFRPQARLWCTYAQECAVKLDAVSGAYRRLAGAFHAANVDGAEVPFVADGPLGQTLYPALATSSVRLAETQAVLADTLAHTAREAYIVKETLTNRHLLMRDLLKAQNSSREHHQRATRLKGTGTANPQRLDDAIAQLEQATHLEKRITATVHRVTENLVAEKQLVQGRISSDLLNAISQTALSAIDAERAALAALEGPRSSQRGHDVWSDRVERAAHDEEQVQEDVLDSAAAARMLSLEL